MRTWYVLALSLLAVACREEDSNSQAGTPSIQDELADAEARYATYPAELERLTGGAMDGSASASPNQTDPPGWTLYRWGETPLSESADLWANPQNRAEFFLTLTDFKGDPEFPGDATYLVDTEVETVGEAPQATYWCVTGGPYRGSALSVTFMSDRQDVFLKSPGFLALRGDTSCT